MSRRWRPILLKILRWAPIALPGSFTLFVVVTVMAIASLSEGTRKSHRRDWPNYYRTDVSRQFKLPPQAKVVLREDHSP